MPQKLLAETYEQGIFDWSPPPFFQSDPYRRAGAAVYLHMTSRTVIPTFSIEDKKGAKVAERDVMEMIAMCHGCQPLASVAYSLAVTPVSLLPSVLPPPLPVLPHSQNVSENFTPCVGMLSKLNGTDRSGSFIGFV